MNKNMIAIFVIIFSLSMVPLANAQNLHGWEWAVNVGDAWEYEMVADYGILQDRTNVLINITSLQNLSEITNVHDIKTGSRITNVDGSELSDIRKNATAFFNSSVALPIGNWSYISENAEELIGDYYLLLSIIVDVDVVENSTHFGFNFGHQNATVGLYMNATWLKSDGSLLFYNVTFVNPFLDVSLSFDRVAPSEPSVLDDVIAFVEDNLLLVVGVVAVLCIVAGIANKK